MVPGSGLITAPFPAAVMFWKLDEVMVMGSNVDRAAPLACEIRFAKEQLDM